MTRPFIDPGMPVEVVRVTGLKVFVKALTP